MKTTFIISIKVRNGYAGDTAVVYLCYDPETLKVLAVHPFGFYNFGLPDIISPEEAVWMVENHPFSKDRQVQ